MNDALLRSEISLLRSSVKSLSGTIEKLRIAVRDLNTTITQKMQKEKLDYRLKQHEKTFNS